MAAIVGKASRFLSCGGLHMNTMNKQNIVIPWAVKAVTIK